MFVICTVEKGREPEQVEWFFDWLDELVARKRSNIKSTRMQFAIMGYGDFSGRSTRRQNRVCVICDFTLLYFNIFLSLVLCVLILFVFFNR